MTKAKVNKMLTSIDKKEYEMPNGTAWQQDHARHVEFFFNKPSDDLEIVAKVLYGLQDLQIRDYAMGVMIQGDLIQRQALYTLVNYSSGKYQKPAKTLLALWHWEADNKNQAGYLLSEVKNYPLADLLMRCMIANWPSESFETMRKELHPQVTEKIFGLQLATTN